MSSESENGFFSRWSKRKQAIAAGEEVVEHAPGLEPVEAETEAPAIDPEREAELEANRQAAEAINLDEMEYDSDFSPFFKDGVPTLLRQKAMRLLWRSNPILANIDGLCDYDENFGDPALILEKFESAYKIGKGYLIEETEEVPDTEEAVAEAVEDADNLVEEETLAEADSEEEATEELAADDPDEGDVTSEDPEIEMAETAEFIEEPAPPRVSLRKRLQFEV